MTKAENNPKNGENGDRVDEPISIIEKGRTSDVRVSLSEFHGRSYLDIRTHVVVDATGDRVPTRKGVTLAIDKIPQLREAIEAVETEARELGLLGGERDERDEAA